MVVATDNKSELIVNTAGKKLISFAEVEQLMKNFEDNYNKGDYAGAVDAYKKTCDVKVNGGTECGGVFSGKTKDEFAAFLKYMREELNAKDMQFLVTSVNSLKANVHTDTFTTTAGVGSCVATWAFDEEQQKWETIKDQITFAFHEKPFISHEVVCEKMLEFEQCYNKGDFPGAAKAYADNCFVTVNGGKEQNGPFTGKTKEEFEGFLQFMYETVGARDMHFTVTSVKDNVHTDTFVTTKGNGACIAKWALVEEEWKTVQDQITWVPFEEVDEAAA
ncbi:unnamed protein product [Amoebophrya sp. A120]|nr:unnamed protein product [Amoebophrya sp. A120]|eukprot:GSA120T00007522001.1